MHEPITIRDMPKLESPFVREDRICTPVIPDEYRWVFSDKSVAVDKLDGTGVSVLVRDGHVIRMFNRGHQVSLFSLASIPFYTGVVKAIEKGHFIPGDDGQFFGELIGPGIQKNPYEIGSPKWVPFDYLKEKYYYKFWPGIVADFKGWSDESIFNRVSELFKKLWSIYKRLTGFRGHDKVDEKMGFSGCAAEGIVFYGPDGQMCKLRRNMFDWFGAEKRRKS